jgi:ribosomal-protein-alanine N-acetyltransferase
MARRPRVVLREPRARDAEAFLEAVRRSRSLHRPWVYPPRDRETFDAWRLRVRRASHAGFLLCRADDGALAGVANLNEIVRGGLQSAYLGFYAFVPHAGAGYMAAGLQALLGRAFGEMGLHRVEANVQPRNARSLLLVERLGFRREGFSPRYLKIGGRWRDHVRLALLAEEWRAR